MNRCALLLIVLIALASAAQPNPRDYIDERTGHRVIRLSPDEGSSSSFYFHQNAFPAGGQEMVYASAQLGKRRLYTVHLETLEHRRITDRNSSREVVAPNSRNVYYLSVNTVCVTDIDTGATRDICVIPEEYPKGAGLTVNADETLLAGSFAEGITEWFQKPRSEWFEGIFEAKLLNGLYTIDIDSGELKVFHTENNWLGHIQFSPTDPALLMYCHEGPWDRLQRIWLIRTDGSERRPVHMRSMDKEIYGHEFWDPRGNRIWYDLQKPMWKNFYIGGTHIETGEEVAYAIQPEHWSYHFNCNADATRFCGDGGAVKHGAGKDTSGIYLFTLRNGKLDATMLCALPDHKYSLEPNVRFSPDEQWVIFRANHQGSSQVYAVETMVVKEGDDRSARDL